MRVERGVKPRRPDVATQARILGGHASHQLTQFDPGSRFVQGTTSGATGGERSREECFETYYG